MLPVRGSIMTDDAIVNSLKSSATGAFPVATGKSVDELERAIGFAVPPLLRRVYEEVGNGGFGWDGGKLIGVGDGHRGDFGNAELTYREQVEGSVSIGRVWPVGLLPFCEWGGSLYSCVDCVAGIPLVHTADHCRVASAKIAFEEFFVRWMRSQPILELETYERVEVINPFTRTRTIIARLVIPE